MKLKRICLLAVLITMIGMPSVSAWKDYPTIYQVDWPKGVHSDGDNLWFTAWIKNDNGKSYECKVTLLVTDPDGNRAPPKKSRTVTVGPFEKAKVDINYKISSYVHHPPGTYGASMELTPGGSKHSTGRAFTVV